MTAGHLRRLEKLEEAMLPPSGVEALRLMTTDEIEVRILALVFGCPTSEEPEDAFSAQVIAIVARIKEGILTQAQLRRGPAYDQRASDLAPLLKGGTYVPAVTPDGEGDALSTPRLMARRAALWAHPAVVRVIETAEQAA